MKSKMKQLFALDALCLGCLIYQQLLAVMGLGLALAGVEWPSSGITAGSSVEHRFAKC